jgi:hypothetical protein
MIFKNTDSHGFQTKVSDGEPWRPYVWQNDWAYHFPNIQEMGKFSIYRGTGKPDPLQGATLLDNKISIRLPWTVLQFTDPSSSQVLDDAQGPEICNDNYACGGQYLNHVTSEGIAVTLVWGNQTAELPVYTWDGWDVSYAAFADKGLDHPELLSIPHDALAGYQETEMLDSAMFIEEEKASLQIVRDELLNHPYEPK